MLEGKTVLLGVTGSIAAYKIAYLASALKKQQADVRTGKCQCDRQAGSWNCRRHAYNHHYGMQMQEIYFSGDEHQYV